MIAKLTSVHENVTDDIFYSEGEKTLYKSAPDEEKRIFIINRLSLEDNYIIELYE